MARDAKPSVTLRDVARAAGVSKSTASNVFNRPEVVREDARERVRAAAARLGYAGPDLHARLLVARRVNAIGVATTAPLSYFFDDPWARALLSEITAACDARSAGLALVSGRDEGRAAWNVQNALVDGFVLLCVEGAGEHLVRLTRRRGLPFVALSFDGDEGIPAISVDNRGGARAAAGHLLALGHRRFGVLGLGTSGTPRGLGTLDQALEELPGSTRDRLLGYRDALGAAGPEAGAMPFVHAADDEAALAHGLSALFTAAVPPTALLAMSDKVAMAAMDWLARRGLRVPADVSVVGFDGVPEGARATPALTTAAQPLPRIAARAVEAIIDGAMPEGRETLPVTLVERASTGPAPRA